MFRKKLLQRANHPLPQIQAGLLSLPLSAYNPGFELGLMSDCFECLEKVTRPALGIWIFAACRSMISVWLAWPSWVRTWF